ncbi:threonine export protein RhtC [Rosenbergiella australiborealis]|uniref:Threonine export protein RhtC n=1 Tax=Rosenbergiella australiborealis TaxID=1544696 RepID=A0ABS5T9A5_9GAMM|nr:threonine export protein RhtC [Rosenbergiella australiborealis]MBT0727543.1 threonine export protein RhtC [Rosenbergiella australiborealis]
MITLFLTVALVQIVALASPGPDFFFISQTAASQSRRDAFKGVMGITLAVAIWAAVALLGLNILLKKMAWLHQLILWAGGAYLTWMGIQMLRSACQTRTSSSEQTTVVPTSRKKNTFIRGLLTNLSNPKAIIYFGSIFSLIVGNDVSNVTRTAIFILIVAETLIWFSLVATLFSLPWMKAKYQQLAKWIDGVAGTLFVAFGLHLIFSR